MSEEILYLNWKNHYSSLYGSFLQLFTNTEGKVSYDDATIACDGKLYPVHRLVLSVCSPYFSDIFSATNATGRHPVIVLKDISSDIFEILLKFIYLGEVNIEQHKFHKLMSAAHCLKISGLVGYDTASEEANAQDVLSLDRNKRTRSPNSSPPRSIYDTEKDPIKIPAAKIRKTSAVSDNLKKASSNSASPGYGSLIENSIQTSDITKIQLISNDNGSSDNVSTTRQLSSEIPLLKSVTQQLREQRLRISNNTGLQVNQLDKSSNQSSPNLSRSPSFEGFLHTALTKPVKEEAFSLTSLGKTNLTTLKKSATHRYPSNHNRKKCHKPNSKSEPMMSHCQSTLMASSVKAGPVILEYHTLTNTHSLHEVEDTDLPNTDTVSNVKQCSVKLTALPSLNSNKAAVNNKNKQQNSVLASNLNCPFCTFMAINKQALNDHVNATHSANQKELKFSAPSAKSKQKSKILMDPNGVKGNYTCPLCDHRSTNKKAFQIHFRIHKGGKGLQCPQCTYTTANKIYLMAHRAAHTAGSIIRCLFCQFSALVMSAVQTHMANEHPQHKLQYCHFCPFMMDSQDEKDIHTEHTRFWHPDGGVPFTCPGCNFNSNNKLNYYKHLHHSHFQNNKCLCSLCHFETYDSHIFSMHVSAHKVKCNATQGTKKKRKIESNIPAHDLQKGKTNISRNSKNKRPKASFSDFFEKCTDCEDDIYSCKSCNFRGSEVEANYHLYNHTVSKKFKCAFCSYSSSYKSILNNHVKKNHTNLSECLLKTSQFKALNSDAAEKNSKHHLSEPDAAAVSQSGSSTVKKKTKIIFRKAKLVKEKELILYSDAVALKPLLPIDDSNPYVIYYEKRGFRCTECFVFSSTKTEMLEHQQEHHKLKPYSCKYCHYRSSEVRSIMKHRARISHRSEPFKVFRCTSCNYSSCNAIHLHVKMCSSFAKLDQTDGTDMIRNVNKIEKHDNSTGNVATALINRTMDGEAHLDHDNSLEESRDCSPLPSINAHSSHIREAVHGQFAVDELHCSTSEDKLVDVKEENLTQQNTFSTDNEQIVPNMQINVGKHLNIDAKDEQCTLNMEIHPCAPLMTEGEDGQCNRNMEVSLNEQLNENTKSKQSVSKVEINVFELKSQVSVNEPTNFIVKTNSNIEIGQITPSLEINLLSKSPNYDTASEPIPTSSVITNKQLPCNTDHESVTALTKMKFDNETSKENENGSIEPPTKILSNEQTIENVEGGQVPLNVEVPNSERVGEESDVGSQLLTE